jgi:hypothetical protein
LVSQLDAAVQHCCSGAHLRDQLIVIYQRSELQRAHACIIVEFNLSPAEAADNAPAMALCKFTEFVFRHVPENPQLRRLGNEILRAYRKSLPDLGGESWQIVVHPFPV